MQIVFQYPNVFLLILAPLIILGFLIITNKSGLEEYFSKRALKKLQSKSGLSQRQRNLFLFFALIFLTIALSKPILIYNENSYNLYKVFLLGCTLLSVFGFYSIFKK
ncbi:hypothetical protein [Arcobacter sp. FWKO B]|uniref:hypothetical protein n=1 Tax=Arcobacter sp. FWKO B TaxID=2593672 RepID=UPI0018A40276|nr:hypothetical protein [Arcobacter sp. FWKO B]QOG12049.1 hypothetical protein FWKOB_04715 [Arcobacter sp. FWKO B]